MHEHEHDLRPSLAELFRSLRGRAAVSGDELAAILRGDARRRGRPPTPAGWSGSSPSSISCASMPTRRR